MTEIAIRAEDHAAQRERDSTLTELAEAALAARLRPNTRRRYQAWWRDFTTWCTHNGRTSLPATQETVTSYITYLCYQRPADSGPSKGQAGLSPSSVDQARWAIARIHQAAGYEPPSMKKSLDILNGYKDNLAAAKDPRRRQRTAATVTAGGLQQLAQAPGFEGITGLRDRCMVLLWYSLGARVSEIVGLNIEEVTEGPEGLTVAMYREKTATDRLYAIPTRHAPQAVQAFCAWRDTMATELGRARGPLFVHLHHGIIEAKAGKPDGNPDGRLSAAGAEYILKRSFKRAGIDGTWSGHSMRRAMITESHRAGHDPITIARQSGHQRGSAILLGYIEEADMWTKNALEGCGI